jgi:hypothetical protein
MMKALTLFLKISAVIQVAYWSVSHLFFPQWYLNSVGMTELAANPAPVLIFMHEIGILTLGVGIATWLASLNPVRNFHIIVMLYVIAVGSMGTSLYHILVHRSATGEWVTVAVLLAQLIILTLLYPWKKAVASDKAPAEII